MTDGDMFMTSMTKCDREQSWALFKNRSNFLDPTHINCNQTELNPSSTQLTKCSATVQTLYALSTYVVLLVFHVHERSLFEVEITSVTARLERISDIA